jgi:hypothetical protein
LGDELACEGFGQNALIEVVQKFQGLCGLGGKAVDLGEACFDAADDFALFFRRNVWDVDLERLINGFGCAEMSA